MMEIDIDDLDANFKAPEPESKDGFLWFSAPDARSAVRGLVWRNENNGSFIRLPLRVTVHGFHCKQVA